MFKPNPSTTKLKSIKKWKKKNCNCFVCNFQRNNKIPQDFRLFFKSIHKKYPTFCRKKHDSVTGERARERERERERLF
jgi:hypothetical protein